MRYPKFVTVFALSCLLLGAFAAQAGTVSVPDNAHRKNYGSGWECDKGFREEDSSCAAVHVPENAFGTNSSFGLGWECSWGFRQAGQHCVAFRVPENAYLNAFGDKWKCDRGFKARGDRCHKIAIPENAHLDFSGNDWECDRPNRKITGKCALP
jgi:hypothetical protein